MKSKISLITIWTNDIIGMKKFYTEVLGFKVSNDLDNYVELDNEGVRFAICDRSVMHDFNGAFKEKTTGQAFELAFPCESIEDLDKSYMGLITKGARAIKEPMNMPWNQRTALFADPDGNIHEIFVDL